MLYIEKPDVSKIRGRTISKLGCVSLATNVKMDDMETTEIQNEGIKWFELRFKYGFVLSIPLSRNYKAAKPFPVKNRSTANLEVKNIVNR